jgi:Domain of unknown function (DUF4440)
MPRVRYALVTAVVAALLLPLPGVATANGDHSRGAGKSRQVERLRRIEKKRLQALVDANVAVAGRLTANDYELINPLGEVLTRNDLLGAVGAGALDFVSDTITSRIRVRLHRDAAALRYRHTISVALGGVGHLTHPAWTTALYERRNGHWQIVWEQTGAIGPVPPPS